MPELLHSFLPLLLPQMVRFSHFEPIGRFVSVSAATGPWLGYPVCVAATIPVTKCRGEMLCRFDRFGCYWRDDTDAHTCAKVCAAFALGIMLSRNRNVSAKDSDSKSFSRYGSLESRKDARQ